jgi:hypothetical protein
MQLQRSGMSPARGRRATVVLAGLAGMLLLPGCRHHRHPAGTVVTASPAGEGDALRFHLRELEAQAGDGGEVRSWVGSYDAGGKTARFRIELTLRPPEANTPIAFTTGAFGREAGSESSTFLKELGRVLEAKAKPKPGRRLDRLPFTAALLGAPSSHSSAGRGETGPAPAPKDERIMTKVFVADGAGEFYLNLDPANGVGEITMKDPDYGDTVVKELARVL